MTPGILVRGVFRNEGLRFAFADTSDLCSSGILIHDCDPASAEVLCDLLTASALTAVLLDEGEKYSILLNYTGGCAGKWLADADSACHVRALPGNTRRRCRCGVRNFSCIHPGDEVQGGAGAQFRGSGSGNGISGTGSCHVFQFE